MEGSASMLKLIFDGHIPSKKNSKRFVKRGKRMVSIPSETHEKWHNTWMSAWSNLPTVTEPVKISYEFWIGGTVSPRAFDQKPMGFNPRRFRAAFPE
jgi:hypothetical protein